MTVQPRDRVFRKMSQILKFNKLNQNYSRKRKRRRSLDEREKYILN